MLFDVILFFELHMLFGNKKTKHIKKPDKISSFITSFLGKLI